MPELLLSLQTSTPSLLTQLALPAAMFAIFYFLVFRPQRQEAENHAKLVAGLQRGDQVVTNAGIHGKIHEARGDTLVLEIASNSFLTVDRDSIKRKKTTESQEAPKA
jgi:preprotein translocase subunit YajC